VTSNGFNAGVAECNQLMYWGSHHYPKAVLSESDKSKLLNSRMFHRGPSPSAPDFDCDGLLAIESSSAPSPNR
jgi:hypothetical protein